MYRYDATDPTHKDSCPDNCNSVESTTLANADTLVMTQSDNRMTRGIVEKCGKPGHGQPGGRAGHDAHRHQAHIGCPTALTHHRIAKGGSCQYGGGVTLPISWANGSMTSIPVKSGRAVTLVDYFYGDYFDQVSFAGAAKTSALAAARSTAFQQALRPAIRAALATW